MIKQVLEQRAARYGSYTIHSSVKEGMVSILQTLPNWQLAGATRRQAATMIIDKLARAFNGDPTYEDNWIDIQGYARLAQDETASHGVHAEASSDIGTEDNPAEPSFYEHKVCMFCDTELINHNEKLVGLCPKHYTLKNSCGSCIHRAITGECTIAEKSVAHLRLHPDHHGCSAYQHKQGGKDDDETT